MSWWASGRRLVQVGVGRRLDPSRVLRECADETFWRKRERRERRGTRRLVFAIGERFRRGADGALTLRSLGLFVAVFTLAAVTAFIVLEVVATEVGPHVISRGWLSRLWMPLQPGQYEVLLSAIAGVCGVLLALYFTTVGVVASNAYSRVPGQLRRLFLTERTGAWYIRLLAADVAISIVILGCRLVDYEPHTLTVAAVSLASVAAILMLVVLGSRLFVFFDLATLGAPLPRRWTRAVNEVRRDRRRKTLVCMSRRPNGRLGRADVLAGKQLGDGERRDLAYHLRSRQVLLTIRELVTAMVTADTGELAPLNRVGTTVLFCWATYAAAKGGIPTRSPFYGERYEHPNALTIDHTRQRMAIDTRTMIQPTLGSDPLWVEHDLADRLDELLTRLLADPDWFAALELLETAGGLTDTLARRLQIDEALLLWVRVRARVISALQETPQTPGRLRTPAERLTYQLAAVDHITKMLTRILLGLAAAARELRPELVGEAVSNALRLSTSEAPPRTRGAQDEGPATSATGQGAEDLDPTRPEFNVELLTAPPARLSPLRRAMQGLDDRRRRLQTVRRRFVASRARRRSGVYALGAPRRLLEQLEDMETRIAVERIAEGRPVTPAWWVSDQVGRTLTIMIHDGLTEVLDAVHAFYITPGIADTDLAPEVRVHLRLSALETVHKVRFHTRDMQRCFAQIASLDSGVLGDGWPSCALPHDRDEAAWTVWERRLELELAAGLGDLPLQPHDSTRPDYYGQAFALISDVAFQAIVEGDDAHALTMYQAVLFGALRANDRLIQDLADVPLRQQVVFGTEPLVDVMALSGYARVFESVYGHGIWGGVRGMWDELLSRSASPTLIIQRCLTSVAMREQLFALTNGGLRRTQLRMRANQAMRSAGLAGRTRYRSPFDGPDEGPAHMDPVVAEFAPSEYDRQDAEDLFIVEYLRHRPEASGMELPRGSVELIDALYGERARKRGATGRSSTRKQRSPAADDTDLGVTGDSPTVDRAVPPRGRRRKQDGEPDA